MGLIDFIFPKYCVNCKAVGSYLCADCFSRLSFDTENICAECSKPAFLGITHPKCKKRTSLEGTFSAIVLNSVARKLVYQFKYKPYLTDLRKIISVVENKEADLAIGQRQTTKHFAEKIFAAYTDFKYGIEDPLCGLKAYSREVYQAVGHFDTIKSIGTQLMIEAVMKGFKIKSVPVYIKEREDNSRFYFNQWRANYKIFMAMVKVILFVK